MDRNMAAMEQAIKELTVRVLGQQMRIDGLVATMGSMVQRMNSLDRVVNLQKAAISGHGPTVIG